MLLTSGGCGWRAASWISAGLTWCCGLGPDSVCCCCRKVPGFLPARWSKEAGARPRWPEDLQLGPTGSLPLPHVPTRHGQDQSRPTPAALQLWVLYPGPPSLQLLNEASGVLRVEYFMTRKKKTSSFLSFAFQRSSRPATPHSLTCHRTVEGWQQWDPSRCQSLRR